MNIFVTGTDTGVGKTIVSALLCKALNAGYWKPIQSGTIETIDTLTVRALTSLPPDHFYPESYTLTEPLSPHAAAAIDGVHINLNAVHLPAYKQEHLVIEGAGGVLVPLNENALVIDLIAQLKTPVVVVARSALGTINHTLLTLSALRHRGIPTLGVIINGDRNSGNAEAIRKYGRTEIIAEIEPFPLTKDGVTHAAKQLSNLASVYSNENGGPAAARALSQRVLPTA